ncbi:MAG: hypothetical protein JO301_10005 [Chitinophagaceae bacterium]|nr:hypothetical protein [Chitinophagaceae bacterium]
MVQSASWGFQDRLLAHAARRHNWETILIPYTTDQLYTNGYLMSDFKAICVQGPLEKDFAERFHSPAADRLIELGSAWFRNIDIIKNELPLLASGAGNRKRRIIYSGSTSEYFPTASEYKGLDTLLEAINQNTISNAVIVYRPFGHTPELRKAINERYSSIPNLVIEYAQGACYGLSAYASLSEKEELKEYILQIMDADLLVMCLASTLSLDAAYLGVPTIANHVDETGTLVKRHTDLLYEKEGGIRGVPDIPVAHSYEDLITGVQLLLNDRARAQDQCRKTSLQWDYPETDFQETLREIISKPISA